MLRRIKNDRAPERPNAPVPSGSQPQQNPGANSSAHGAAPKELELKNPGGRLGEILVAEKIITPQQLDEGLAQQKKAGGFLGQALIELGHLDQDTLTLVLIKQCKIPHLNLLDYSISPDMKGVIPLELCRKYNLLPVDKMGKILTVAMVDPLNSNALEAIRAAFPELRIKPILCDWPHFQQVFQSFETPVANPQPVSMESTIESEDAAPQPRELPAREPEQVAKPVADAAPEPVAQPLGPALPQVPAWNVDDIKTAIRDGMRESIAVLERRVTEASDLLRKAQEVEQAAVAIQQKRDLGVPADSQTPVVVSTSSIQEFAAGGPGKDLTFENFIVGDNNKAAVGLAKSVAKSPGSDQNPLFVCGDVGLGKTHLITAIGNALKAAHGGLRVGWTSAGRFVDDAASARESRSPEAFRRAYESWDAIILDDVQFLAGRIEAQEDLFHIFNALQERGKQIVLAGDRPPDKLGLLEKRLVSRFDSGIVAHIHAPDWETRIRILRHYAGRLGIKAPDDVLAMIAMRHANDVRRLIGSLRKVAAWAQSNGGAMSAEVASRILAENAAEVAA